MERAIQEVEGTVRSLKFALEERIGGQVIVTDDVSPWLVEHAADCKTRHKLLAEGKTAGHKTIGRTDCPRIADFGEQILSQSALSNAAFGTVSLSD